MVQLASAQQGSPKVALFFLRHEKKQPPALRHCYKKDRRLDDLHTEAAGQLLITRLPTRPTLTCSEVDG
jgi:hypothetical protein